MPGDRRSRPVLRRDVIVLVVRLLVTVLTPCASVRGLAAEPIVQATLLPVPFLPQTEALCGGAAAAMLFRYFGDRHADVQQFAPLVDRVRGGIAADRLLAAIASRGWTTTHSSASIDQLRQQLGQRRPVMLLIEDRPSRYHFVVAVGADDTHVYVHDPTWGPARPIDVKDFVRLWRVTGNWMLVIARDSERPIPVSPPAVVQPSAPSRRPATATACDRAVDEAVAAVQAQGLNAADRILAVVRATCPTSSRPVSELAGVRFAQRRYGEAVNLARAAADLDARDAYAWEVLGSSRFVRNDVTGALTAWNAIERPRLDVVRIEGLSRTRYAFVAHWLPLVPNTVVTPSAYRLAERRLAELPGLASARLQLTPSDDGWAEVTAAVLEQQPVPTSTPAWVAFAARTAVGREFSVDAPGWTGQGDVWSASGRWWTNRPRVAFGVASPIVGRRRGVWRVAASWTAQAYDLATGSRQRDTQRHAGLSLTDWIRSDLRYELHTGFDVWRGSSASTGARTVSAGVTLEQRVAGDRLTLREDGHVWWPAGSRHASATTAVAAQRFQAIDLRAAARSTTRDRGFVTHVALGTVAASSSTPRLLWPGAGDVYVTSPLLRAHPLTDDGIVDSPAFGRRLVFGSIEQRRWFDVGPLVRIAVAAFVDAARASHRRDGATRGPTIVDAGMGLRLRLPGHDDVLRVDYGRGLRDGANVVSVGWQP